MKPRSIRSLLLAAAAVAGGLAIVSATGAPAGAATVSQVLGCGVGGNQTVSLVTSAPATVPAGGTFTVVLAGNGSTSPPAEIKNMVTTFQAPTGSTIVAGSASFSGGSGTLGNVTTTISGSTVNIKVPGPIASGKPFTPPTLQFQLKATGAGGTVLKTTFRQSAGYTLTAAGSFNVSCDANTPLATLTSTTIEAGATTTTTAGATTSTTAGSGSTTTTTAAPTTGTSVWSPTGTCGTVQTTTAPANTQSVSITAATGAGGRSGSQASSATVAGGAGSTAGGTFAASAGQTYSAIVGCAGANGGKFSNPATGGYASGGGTGRGSIIAGQSGSSGGSGAGASAACLGAACTSAAAGVAPLVVAGGGGGGGVSNCSGTGSGAGGAGGAGSSSSDGVGAGSSGSVGASANGSGGAGGVNGSGGAAAGGSNGNGSGGAGVNVVGGGGGGGYAGGAAGSNSSTGCKGAGGGGGGSSWVKATATSPSFTDSTAATVVLTFNLVIPPTTTTTAPCVADKVPFPTVTALVKQQYQDFTGKAPTTAQTNQWVPAITNCTASPDALIVSLLPTNVSNSDDARLVRLYLAYFHRPPDPDGFNYWQAQLDAGKGLINAAKKFSESSEFKRDYGTLDNGQFIDLVYLNVLDRPADPTGRTYWLDRLSKKTANRGDVMINFSESTENIRDKTTHVQVFRMYRSMMAKFPSKAGFFDLVNPILNDGKTLDDAAHTIRLSAAYDARV
ncbi:DUF4214 domain-containing protein [Aquihabitans sp. McL0605]|uniref:DUF4214 domain-containing protein n=1 Tax=Aquihabitans sp. McL0605 TaxID=3415671 RepID=UPI003CE75907